MVYCVQFNDGVLVQKIISRELFEVAKDLHKTQTPVSINTLAVHIHLYVYGGSKPYHANIFRDAERVIAFAKLMDKGQKFFKNIETVREVSY
jgi:hypothetical protein